jgi:hypothetical protein
VCSNMYKMRIASIQEYIIMQIKRYSDGSVKLHIDDEDNYNVTDDNGVDIWLTKKQVERIKGDQG